MVEGFKNTDAGIIPNDWNAPCIKEFTDILSGGTPSTKITEYWGGEIRWMNSGELNLKRVHEVEGRITESGLKNSATKLIPPKCVLVGLAGQGKTRGTVAINYVSLCTNQSIAAILPSKEFDEDYLYHNLDLRYKELRSLSTGDGGRGGLNLTLLRNLPIPLPPTKAEQTAIATALNDADALIQKLEQLIAKKRNIKTGAMQELVKPKEGWEVKEFSDIFRKINGKVFQIKTNEYKTSGEFPIVDQGQEKIVGYTDIERKVFKCPKKGIIVFGDHTRILKFIDFNFAIGADGTQLLEVKEEFSSKFMFYYLFLNEVPNTGYNRHFKFLLEMQFIVPKSKSEQTRIAQILSDMDSEIEALERQLAKYKLLKQGMMQVLLTGKIRLV